MPTLDWIGKDKVINHHLDVPYRVLERQYSYDENGQHTEDNGSENMIIHGDNLSALKSLLPQYEGRIKCIYIDPPYNTGNENWVYNDNVNDPRIKKWLGEVVGKEGEDLSRHDKWLCMMYPRLKLLQRLLHDEGVIFISIGEDEIATLKIICDEIFGYNNRCGIVSRVMKSGGNKGNFFSPNIDYILVYCKNITFTHNFKAPLDEKIIKKLYTGIETDGPRKGQKYRPFGLYQSSLDERPNQRYYIECPDGTFAIPPGATMPTNIADGEKVLPMQGDGCWRWSAERYIEEKAKGLLLFKKSKGVLICPDGTPSKWNVYTKIWLDDRADEGQTPTNLISAYENRHSAKELTPLSIDFDFAKPSKLVEYLINISTTDKDAIILDSYAGSGTTAHAVLNLNKTDGGRRKFILVEMMDYADSLTSERVRRVITGCGEGKSKTEGTGGNFSYYELGDTLMNGNELNETVGVDKIREYVYFTETKSRLAPFKDDEPYYLGTHFTTSYYFCYDKENVTTLSRAFLHTIKTKADSYVIYADLCTLSDAELEKYHITFKKIPRDITKL